MPTDSPSIKSDEELLLGKYVNMAWLVFSQNEFVLDFSLGVPGLPSAVHRARLIMLPVHLKRLGQIILEQITQYEEKFGTISPPGEAPQTTPQN